MAEYKDYTDEEYDAMDEYYTTHLPKTVTGKPGAFTRQKMKMEATVTLDEEVITWVRARAQATHHTPSEVVTELVRREMAFA
jgi:hypothetical protein